VHPVLDLLALGHPLEEHARAGAGRVDHGRRVVAAFRRHAHRRQRLVPGAEAARRILDLVAERLRPERRQLARVGAVERHLDLATHLAVSF
jgi:hypothetical protein